MHSFILLWFFFVCFNCDFITSSKPPPVSDAVGVNNTLSTIVTNSQVVTSSESPETSSLYSIITSESLTTSESRLETSSTSSSASMSFSKALTTSESPGTSSMTSLSFPTTSEALTTSESPETSSTLSSAALTFSKTSTTSESPKTTSSETSIANSQMIICPLEYANTFGTEGRGENGNCEHDSDCLDIGPALNKSLNLDAACIFNRNQSISRCCYRDTSPYCRLGIAVLPLEKCTSLDDCNLQEGFSTERWCDSRKRICCKNEHQEVQMFCPDNVTAVMSEPICEGFKKTDIHSGTCPMKNGICLYGHCCPSSISYGNLLPGTPYKTLSKCTNSSVVEHVNGYCDPGTGRVWIMTEMNFHGQRNKNLSSYCQTSRGCGQSRGKDNVCVRIGKNWLQCFANPERRYYIPKEPNLFVISLTSYVALGTSIFAFLFSLLYKFLKIDKKFPGETTESEKLIESHVSDVVT